MKIKNKEPLPLVSIDNYLRCYKDHWIRAHLSTISQIRKSWEACQVKEQNRVSDSAPRPLLDRNKRWAMCAWWTHRRWRRRNHIPWTRLSCYRRAARSASSLAALSLTSSLILHAGSNHRSWWSISFFQIRILAAVGQAPSSLKTILSEPRAKARHLSRVEICCLMR